MRCKEVIVGNTVQMGLKEKIAKTGTLILLAAAALWNFSQVNSACRGMTGKQAQMCEWAMSAGY